MQAAKADHISAGEPARQRDAAAVRRAGRDPRRLHRLPSRRPSFVLSDVRDPSTRGQRRPLPLHLLLLSSTASTSAWTGFSLHKQHQQREADRLLSTIQALWAKLDVPPSQQQGVMASTASRPLSEASIRAYGEEVVRLEGAEGGADGRASGGRAQGHLGPVGESCTSPISSSLLFRPYWAQPATFDDAFLAVHEAERERLQSVLSEWRPLLSLVEKRFEYRTQLSEFEISSSDPDPAGVEAAHRLPAAEGGGEDAQHGQQVAAQARSAARRPHRALGGRAQGEVDAGRTALPGRAEDRDG